MLCESNQLILLLYILFFCCDAKEKNIHKKRKHANRLITTKLNLKRVNSLYFSHSELVSESKILPLKQHSFCHCFVK